MHIRLIKWALETRPDMSLYVAREILANEEGNAEFYSIKWNPAAVSGDGGEEYYVRYLIVKSQTLVRYAPGHTVLKGRTFLL